MRRSYSPTTRLLQHHQEGRHLTPHSHCDLCREEQSTESIATLILTACEETPKETLMPIRKISLSDLHADIFLEETSQGRFVLNLPLREDGEEDVLINRAAAEALFELYDRLHEAGE